MHFSVENVISDLLLDKKSCCEGKKWKSSRPSNMLWGYIYVICRLRGPYSGKL